MDEGIEINNDVHSVANSYDKIFVGGKVFVYPVKDIEEVNYLAYLTQVFSKSENIPERNVISIYPNPSADQDCYVDNNMNLKVMEIFDNLETKCFLRN